MKTYICKWCGKPFLSEIPKRCCTKCEEIDNSVFLQVEQYLKQHPNSNAIQIADALDIPIMTIIAFIEEGRLEVRKR